MRRGIEQLIPRLEAYAREHGGRFVLFGSAADDTLHDQSDVDLIADFAPDRGIAACAFADRACTELGLVGDVRPMAWTSQDLTARALDTGRVLA
jgi:predicted nucleotidyltransferase